MSILEELKKKIANIETQSLAMDGCRPTFTVSEIMDLIDGVELAQNLPNACTDTIYRQAAIDLVKFECGEWTGLAKTIGNRINELPSAQPEKHTDERTETHVRDCISRQDAIETSLEFFVEFLGGAFYENSQKELIARFQRLPSAEPERKKGKWIYNSPVTMKCNQCGLVIKDWDWHRFKYCPNCISDMRGE